MNAPQRMWSHWLGDPGAADDPGSTVPVQPPAIISEADRSLAALADGQINRPRGCAARAGW